MLDYCVDNVYFSNGGYLYFGEGYTDTFNFGETQTYHDQNENEWEIELTNYKTSHKDVQETKAKYSDDSEKEVTNYTTTPADKSTLDTAGQTEIVVSLEDKSATFKVTVNEA